MRGGGRAGGGGRRAGAGGSRLALRRGAVLYLAAFLLASTAAPHRHGNSAEDLFCGQPSDSGVFLDGAPRTPAGGSDLSVLRVVDDDPCPACFSSDFTASPVPEAVGLAAPGSRCERRHEPRSRSAGAATLLPVPRAPPSGSVQASARRPQPPLLDMEDPWLDTVPDRLPGAPQELPAFC